MGGQESQIEIACQELATAAVDDYFRESGFTTLKDNVAADLNPDLQPHAGTNGGGNLYGQ